MNGAVVYRRMLRLLADNELGRTGKDTVLVYFVVQYGHLLEGTEENRENFVRIDCLLS
jgi:hypothetical protein